MSHIQNIQTHFTVSFPENWWEHYNFHEALSSAQEYFPTFRAFIRELRGRVLDELNKSVLAGEYVGISNFDELITATEFLLNEIQYMPADEDVQTLLQKELNLNFVLCLKEALQSYYQLAIYTQQKFDIDTRTFINVRKIYERKDETTKFHTEVNRQLKYFEANLEIACLDLDLTPHVEDYFQLYGFSKSLLDSRYLGGYETSLILKQKVDFLKTKWVLRQQHMTDKPVYAYENNQVIQLGDTNDLENTIQQYWREKVLSHYEFSSLWRSEIQRDYHLARDKQHPTLLELHRRIKYYKDVNPSVSALKECRQVIYKCYKDLIIADEPRDKRYAYSVALSYAINNEFSLLLDAEDVENQSVVELYGEIERIQLQTSINNFFPQFKYLSSLVTKLEKIYNERKAMDFVARARNIINICETVIARYHANIQWSEQNYNYVFQLPYEECLTPIGSASLPKVYVHSSFVLPLSRERYVSEFTTNQRRVQILKSSIEIFENIEGQMGKYNDKISEISNREIKSMEIIGIFTAIVTFIAGTLPSFKYIETAYQAFLFMFSLALSLAVFVLLILSITRGLKRLRNNALVIGVGMLLALFTWWYLIFQTKDPHKRVVPKTEIPKAADVTE